MGEIRFLRGRGPRPDAPPPPPPPAQPGFGLAFPTSWHQTVAGKDVVVNPNTCGICHRARHADIPHHRFEADLAFPEVARSLGWPMPPEEPLI